MTSAADPTAAFLAALRASGLLAPAQLDDLAAWAAGQRPDVPALAKEVNRRGWLTAYQIREIARGRGPGLVLGQYVVLDLLGEGGMGRVFKAHNTRLGRDEALKVIRADKLKHPSALARFALEMEALGKVSHPNVVTAFDAGPLGDSHFVSMELIEGTDLTRLVAARGPLPVAEACETIRQAALGLHHAFELGMVHRDIKPSNILVSRDGRQVKVVDLGLARLQEAAQVGGNRVTQEGFVIGTPDFLAPEQARNPAGVDIRADLYALGATLFYVLTGKVPYDGANATEKLLKHCTDPPPPLLPLRPDAPPQLEHLLHWCMAKRPEDRPQTPLQLAAALLPFCPRAPGTAPPPAYPPAGPAAAPAVDPVSSSQAFRLPAQANEDDPIRGRAEKRFPVGPVLVGLGSLVVLGILAYAAYRVFRGTDLPPVEAVTNSVGMKLLKIDGGTFDMGSPPTEPGRADGKRPLVDDEAPVRAVTVRGPFLIGATEVTHAQYSKVMGAGPPGSAVIGRAANANDHPAEFVSYNDALDFCQKLTEKERDQPYRRPGWAYRLPTEAEWEYCCRAGTTTPFWCGPTLATGKPRDGTPGGARYTPAGDARETPLEGDPHDDPGVDNIPGKVAKYDPNPWGLYDTHGNVGEWCLDWYKRGYPGADPADNPTGPASGDRRVVRGGSFKDPASACRSAARVGRFPSDRRPDVGFRVVYAPITK